MGSVEVALEQGPEGAGRVVALKLLLPERARDARAKDMFLREARVAALLDHPNVVHALAFGEQDDELFIAMEYVEGEPLSRVLAAAHERREPLDAGLVAGLLAQVCDGLHAAHELRDAGGHLLHVVHRDVSPHNVMVSYAGHAKVLDFGVAKFENDAGGARTRTGEVKGKMAYMSPEQALGETLDRRADLYGVGAVLFECLAGQRMWGAGTDLDVMRKLALEEPPRLDAIARDVPEALVELHARLVARDPAARPQTAREVADALRAVAPDDTVDGVRALLSRLFPGEEAVKRKRLTDGLAQTGPARGPESAAPAREYDATPVGAQGKRWMARPWAGAIGIAVVGMVVAGAWKAAGGGRASDEVSESAGANAGAGAGAGANANAGAGANEELLVRAGAAAERSEGSSRVAVSASGAAAEIGAAARPRKAARPAAPVKGTQATRPPDVDPSPF